MDRRYRKRMDRYWAKMVRKLDDELSCLDPKDWFDLWHVHPDWYGKGNARPESKLRADELTYEYLKKFESLIFSERNDVQCWGVFAGDKADNAIYIHSENPNGTEYPFTYNHVCWGKTNEAIQHVIDDATHQVGFYEFSPELDLYFVRKVSS